MNRIKSFPKIFVGVVCMFVGGGLVGNAAAIDATPSEPLVVLAKVGDFPITDLEYSLVRVQVRARALQRADEAGFKKTEEMLAEAQARSLREETQKEIILSKVIQIWSQELGVGKVIDMQEFAAEPPTRFVPAVEGKIRPSVGPTSLSLWERYSCSIDDMRAALRKKLARQERDRKQVDRGTERTAGMKQSSADSESFDTLLAQRMKAAAITVYSPLMAPVDLTSR